MAQEDFLAKYLTEVTARFAKWLVAPIKDQFMVYFCFNSNIRSLTDEANELDKTRATLQLQVDGAINNARVIAPDVVAWFEKAKQFQDEKEGIELRIPTVQKGCLSITSRIPLSKEAKKTAESMKKHRAGRRHLDPLSLSPPPEAAKVPNLTETTYEIESRKEIEKRIMDALRDGNVNLVGICGMGGIGKTNMASKLRQRAKEENLFDETVMVTVSQTVNISGIQTVIAEMLGIKNFKDLESREARANKLGERLCGTRRILVVVDDIWEELKLEQDLGIRCGNDSKGCTVLLTSRNEEVLKQMNVRAFGLNSLPESDAWILFRKIAGDCVDDQSLVKTAEEVSKECNGLPIAIVTMGSALKDKKLPIWKDALHKLKGFDMPQDMKEKVHIRLRLSYDLLEDQEAESLLLLCSLFPEDFDIELDHLALCSMELKIIGGISNMEQARNRIFAITKKLKSRFLLLDGRYENSVKMHDVIHDMAIYIAKEIRLVDAQSGLRGHLDMDSESILQPGGSDLSLGHLMGSEPSRFIGWDLIQPHLERLIGEGVNVIGICGWGGIGKTTLVTRVRQRAMELNLFDESVMVVGCSVMNMLKIQLDIAQQLGCKEGLRNLDTLQERAKILSSRLRGRRTLIVLDDVWNRIKLEDLGIPCGKDSKDCTVLLISRNEKSIREMTTAIFGLHSLPRTDAWSLFQKTTETCWDDPRLERIGEEIVENSMGVRISIVTIGSALKDQEMSIWEDALRQLQTPEGHLNFFFRDPEVKPLCVLCSLLPQDSTISIEDLALYSMQFKIFGGINNLEQATKRVITIAKKLKCGFFLSDDDRQIHVKIHPLIPHAVNRKFYRKG